MTGMLNVRSYSQYKHDAHARAVFNHGLREQAPGSGLVSVKTTVVELPGNQLLGALCELGVGLFLCRSFSIRHCILDICHFTGFWYQTTFAEA